ncbi:MAG: hypothetical protein ACKO65_00100 [Betaproteobacteria bacterium]
MHFLEEFVYSTSSAATVVSIIASNPRKNCSSTTCVWEVAAYLGQSDQRLTGEPGDK